MVDLNVIDNLPVPPSVPPYRTFKVTRADNSEVVIEAHAVDETPSGSIMFFEYGFEVSNAKESETGFKPVSKMRRSFAVGTWTDLEEVMVLRQRSSIIMN